MHYQKHSNTITQYFVLTFMSTHCRAHYSTIVPLLVMQKDIAAVKTVAETIGSEWCHLLEACVPKVLVHILPLFAMSKCGKVTSLRNMQTKVAHATACYDSLVAVVKQEVGRHTFYKINKIVI